MKNGVIDTGATIGVRSLRGYLNRDNPNGNGKVDLAAANLNYTVVKPFSKR